MFGFGITLRSLFQHDHEKREDEDYSGVNLIEGFSTITSTQITLWDAMLGQHDFNQIDGNSPYFVLGIILMGTFILLTMVILFNLLIAKMSTTYEQKEKASLEDWEYESLQWLHDEPDAHERGLCKAAVLYKWGTTAFLTHFPRVGHNCGVSPN